MDNYLAQLYGTAGAPTEDEEIEKVASYAAQRADEEGIDVEQLSEEDLGNLVKLAQAEIFGVGLEKFAGQVMAHAFTQESKTISDQYAEKGFTHPVEVLRAAAEGKLKEADLHPSPKLQAYVEEMTKEAAMPAGMAKVLSFLQAKGFRGTFAKSRGVMTAPGKPTALHKALMTAAKKNPGQAAYLAALGAGAAGAGAYGAKKAMGG